MSHLKMSFAVSCTGRTAPFFILLLFSFGAPFATHSACQVSGLSSCRPSCPDGRHDYRDEGVGTLRISRRSTLTWRTVERDKFLGITVSSNEEAGAVQVSKHFRVTSSVTVCSKCRRATGMVLMTLTQLQQLAWKHPELGPLLDTALRTRP